MTGPLTLPEVLAIAQDLYRLRAMTQADMHFRKTDLRGAWAAEGGLGKLRVIALAPLSMAEHLLNRATAGTARAGLNPALALALRGLEGTEATRPYGPDLASRVADTLIARLQPDPSAGGRRMSSMAYHHRDFCGTGLLCDESPEGLVFSMAYFSDGYPDDAVLQFHGRDAFVAWLAEQTDLSMSGLVGPPPLEDWAKMGNQRILRARLDAFVTLP